MAQHYSNEARETDAYALPDLETFQLTAYDVRTRTYLDDSGEPLPEGWYYWYCFPGCLPDSEPIGPFETQAEALADARANAEE